MRRSQDSEPRGPETPWRFHFRALGLSDAIAASRWRYTGEYAMYNLGLAPLLVAVGLRGPFSALTGVSYYAVTTEYDGLVGVFSLTKRGGDVEIGVGLRPDLTGHGLGLPFLLQGLEVARRRYHPRTFSLHVATFNRRAISVYERADFLPGCVTPFTYKSRAYEELRMSRPAS
ncbi:MAG TPA: GNAT family N-acetyltransferase [Ktedonobacterales bacterium]|nr:GNAT family N-acetyltransferase [Ktedonobacterales bacterium]